MPFADEDLDTIAAMVGELLLGVSPLRVGAEEPPELAREPVAFVELTGAWEGIVALRLSPGLLSRAAQTYLGLAPGEASEEDLADVRRELANVVGGNFKTLLNRPTQLSLPFVDGEAALRTGRGPMRERCRRAFSAAGEPLCIAIYERAQV